MLFVNRQHSNNLQDAGARNIHSNNTRAMAGGTAGDYSAREMDTLDQQMLGQVTELQN